VVLDGASLDGVVLGGVVLECVSLDGYLYNVISIWCSSRSVLDCTVYISLVWVGVVGCILVWCG
jgi:hypothetical protein